MKKEFNMDLIRISALKRLTAGICFSLPLFLVPAVLCAAEPRAGQKMFSDKLSFEERVEQYSDPESNGFIVSMSPGYDNKYLTQINQIISERGGAGAKINPTMREFAAKAGGVTYGLRYLNGTGSAKGPASTDTVKGVSLSIYSVFFSGAKYFKSRGPVQFYIPFAVDYPYTSINMDGKDYSAMSFFIFSSGLGALIHSGTRFSLDMGVDYRIGLWNWALEEADSWDSRTATFRYLRNRAGKKVVFDMGGIQYRIGVKLYFR